MKFLKYLQEARRNPELNPKIPSVVNLEKYENRKNVFVSFTQINKLGINPTSNYNTPIGIYQKHHFPIYLDSSMKEHDQIAVSSGEVGRSIMINPDDLQKVTDDTFVDLLEK